MGNFDNVSIIIPALNPDQKLLNLVNDLIVAEFNSINIINDGSKLESRAIFNARSRG